MNIFVWQCPAARINGNLDLMCLQMQDRFLNLCILYITYIIPFLDNWKRSRIDVQVKK